MIRTVLLITGSLQNIPGSGINILYLLTGPIVCGLTCERDCCPAADDGADVTDRRDALVDALVRTM